MDSADISGTTLFDKSGNSNDGTIYGAVSAGGQINEALDFDGSDDYVYLDDPVTNSNPTFDNTFNSFSQTRICTS